VITESGSYKVKVTNGTTSCENTSTASTVTINPLPTASVTGTLTACVTTTLTAVTNATTPTYNWYKNDVVIDSQTASTLVVTASGAYKVKVTNGTTSCENTSTASSVTINPLPTASITGTLTACVTTTLTAVSNAASPSYVWYKDDVVIVSQTASTLVVTESGSYKVKVKNGDTSCENTSSGSTLVINSLPAITTQPSSPSAVCAGSGTPSFTVTATGTGLTYQWEEYISSWANLTNVGVYSGVTTSTLTITSPAIGMNGYKYRCLVSGTCYPAVTSNGMATLSVNALPVANAITGGNSVFLGSNLTLIPHATGTGALTFTWASSNTGVATISNSGVITPVAVGSTNITYTVTDGSSTTCQATSANYEVTVTDLPTATITGTLTACVTTTLTAVSDAASPSYVWYKDDVVIDGQTASALVVSVSGAYKVKVTNGVTSGENTSIASAVIINALPTPGLTSSDYNNIICAGDAVTFTATGAGTGTYELFVDAASQGAAGTATTFTTSALTSGQVVTVKVTNANGCIASSSGITTTVNALPIPGLKSDDADNIICAGESVTFTATGGSAYQFFVGDVSQGGASATTTFTTSTLTSGQTVSAKVTNAGGCVATTVGITTTVKDLPQGSLSGNGPLCVSGTRELTWTATAGTGPFTIVYNDGTADRTANSVTSGIPFTISAVPGSSSTTYTLVSVADFSCQRTLGFTGSSATITISPSLPVSVDVTASSNPVCAGTSVTFTAVPTNGGTNPGYQWKVNGTDAGTNNNTLSYKPANNDAVTVTLTSNENCQTGTQATSAPITMTIKSSPVVSTAKVTPESVCASGQVEFTATASAGTIRWYTSLTGGSEVTVLNPVISTTTTYYAEAINLQGCVSDSRTTVTAIVNASPTVISATASPASVCGSGQVALSATASTGTIKWYTASTGGTEVTVTDPVISTTTTYYAEATSPEGCVSAARVSVTATVIPLPAAPAAGAITHPSCTIATGSVVLTGLPSTGLWTLTRSPGGTTFTGTGTTSSITGLTPGTYTYTVTNAAGCTSASSADIVIKAAPAILEGSITTLADASCFGSADGSVSISASGGVSPYRFSIDGGTFRSEGTFNNLKAGSYSITVIDTNLCTTIVHGLITEPTELALTANKEDATCINSSDGRIELTTTGGTMPYNYIWSDGTTTSYLTNIPAGTYNAVVYDIRGCSISIDVVVGTLGSANCLKIQEIITPNNDGTYDTWIIKNIEMFPDAEVQIFNMWGKRVFSTKNISSNPWDGTYKGELLPTDSYHYILYLNDGSEPISGVISIIR
jgi:gliding motility-associated-like protein